VEDEPVAERKVAHQQPNRISVFFRETIGELRKVNWPTWEEAKNLTIIVLIVIAVMALFLGLLDLAFAELFRLILG
jgi:preprotein translocase subunit SecE